MTTSKVTFTEILQDVKPTWKQVFKSPAILDNLKATLTKIINNNPKLDQLAPPPKDIFNAFKYVDPDDVRVIILGQDPYPKKGDAHGLSFSVNKGIVIPPSLKNIFKALEKSNQITQVPKNNGNLNAWAEQGVLMLNSCLTTEIGSSKHPFHACWEPFTSYIVRYIINNHIEKKIPISVMAWGNYAKEIIERTPIDDPESTYLQILRWTHPSPLADAKLENFAKFVNCPHFKKVNEHLTSHNQPTINWNVADSEDFISPFTTSNVSLNYLTIICTDGACKKNGKENAEAGYAVYVASGPQAKREFKSKIHSGKKTNQVAELKAIDIALDFINDEIAEQSNPNDFMILTDSTYSINCIIEWGPRWRKTNVEKQNLDIIYPIIDKHDELVKKLETLGRTLTFKHIHSHTTAPPSAGGNHDPIVNLCWEGNKIVDELAQGVC